MVVLKKCLKLVISFYSRTNRKCLFWLQMTLWCNCEMKYRTFTLYMSASSKSRKICCILKAWKKKKINKNTKYKLKSSIYWIPVYQALIDYERIVDKIYGWESTLFMFIYSCYSESSYLPTIVYLEKGLMNF